MNAIDEVSTKNAYKLHTLWGYVETEQMSLHCLYTK